MPKMGESIMEATILNWVKKVGDRIEIDEPVVEIATDKVDSEVPSPVEGRLVEILYQAEAVVEVGKPIAIIETDASASVQASPAVAEAKEIVKNEPSQQIEEDIKIAATLVETDKIVASDAANGQRFYSPLVKSIAQQEGIALHELNAISGSGQGGRVTKSDMLNYVESRQSSEKIHGVVTSPSISKSPTSEAAVAGLQSIAAASISGTTEIIQMDRMRKLIADHMVRSKHTSPHVTSFVEADVTNIVNWREKNKNAFQKKYGEKITYTPIFIQAVARAIADFPMINVSVDGDRIIVKKDINIGMAAALPSGNLIVPVIKGADQYSLVGLTKQVNDLADRARANKLKPEEIQDGTYTVTNVGTFGNVLGTPIINQPQVAILAMGAIKKKPAVLETEHGDVIAIRHMMFLSHSYDHRVVDGYLGGSFVRRVADYLESFDTNQNI